MKKFVVIAVYTAHMVESGMMRIPKLAKSDLSRTEILAMCRLRPFEHMDI